MGALTTLVSPRLFPVRESPMTMEGRSWVTRSPSSTRNAVRLDRRHRLGELVEVVVEAAREDERVLLGDGAPLAPVDVRGLDGDVAHERGPRRLLHGAREGERVAAAEHVGAERVLVGVVEGDAGRAVDHVGQGRAQPGQLRRHRCRGPASRCRRPRSGTCAPSRPRCAGASGAGRRAGPAPRTFTTSFVLWSRIVSGRTTATTSSMRRSSAAWDRISLPRKPVAPVSSTFSRGTAAAGAQDARAASRCSRSTRAFTSFSERCVNSRNLKEVSRLTTPRIRLAQTARRRRCPPRRRPARPRPRPAR